MNAQKRTYAPKITKNLAFRSELPQFLSKTKFCFVGSSERNAHFCAKTGVSLRASPIFIPKIAFSGKSFSRNTYFGGQASVSRGAPTNLISKATLPRPPERPPPRFGTKTARPRKESNDFWYSHERRPNLAFGRISLDRAKP